MTTTPSGRALALPRASAIAKRDWRASSSDALPYADDAEDERRREVDRLVAEEMRRMSKKAKDYAAELAPTRASTLPRDSLVEQEMTRIESGRSMCIPDSLRYRLDPPPHAKRGDVEAWKEAIDNARAQLEHQATRVVNLELALKYAPAAWRARNSWAEASIAQYEREVERARTSVNALNVTRKLHQEAAAKEFRALEKEWYATAAKCVAIESAILDLEEKIGDMT